MKERPILFSGPMVLAILDGRKTQTRRIVNRTDSGRVKLAASARNWHIDDPNVVLACPYGQPSDRLWVRETWADMGTGHTAYRATTDDDTAALMSWKPSIHMHRWRSRLTLEIIDVRIERLQDITKEDAIEEGIQPMHSEIPGEPNWKDYSDPIPFDHEHPIASYRTLWETINGTGSWNSNPWVWVITFHACNLTAP